ncbi:unnamed protein product [Heligmosomoides polygyrus]|uniref:Uncharacterized protein n=1 Tax=Heligmosomoides polygyrus TaxID=6339 RepID=A0A3P8ADD6_HELPZ|nr:unnamed protein product [Heligmosomoides polygyrus]
MLAMVPSVNRLFQGRNNTGAQCMVWSDRTSSEMCALSPEDRLRRFRSTYLFPDLQPISLYSVRAVRDESWSRRLLAGIQGSDCVRETGALCSACFDRLSTALRRLDDAYRSFDQTLFRFDCMPAVDTASATRPFSPNGSCTTCRVQPEALRCGCVHPCDLRGIVAEGEITRSSTAAHDFYPSRQHCETRRRQCARTTAHDRRVPRVTSFRPHLSSVLCLEFVSLLHII